MMQISFMYVLSDTDYLYFSGKDYFFETKEEYFF